MSGFSTQGPHQRAQVKGSCPLEEPWQKRWPEVTFLTLALHPEFFIKIAGFLQAGLGLELTPRGDELVFLQTLSHLLCNLYSATPCDKHTGKSEKKASFISFRLHSWTEPQTTFVCPRGRTSR